MLDISFSELLLCFVVALVVLGPERMPGLARGLGRWTGKARAYMRNLSAELERESSIAELKSQIGDAHRILNEESQAMRRSFDDAAAEGRAIIGEARAHIEPPTGADPNYHGHDPEPALAPPSLAPSAPVSSGVTPPVSSHVTPPADPHV